MGDFDPSESMENAGILDVFLIFHTARLGQKIRRSPLSPPKRCCLIQYAESPVCDRAFDIIGFVKKCQNKFT